MKRAHCSLLLIVLLIGNAFAAGCSVSVRWDGQDICSGSAVQGPTYTNFALNKPYLAAEENSWTHTFASTGLYNPPYYEYSIRSDVDRQTILVNTAETRDEYVQNVTVYQNQTKLVIGNPSGLCYRYSVTNRRDCSYLATVVVINYGELVTNGWGHFFKGKQTVRQDIIFAMIKMSGPESNGEGFRLLAQRYRSRVWELVGNEFTIVPYEGMGDKQDFALAVEPPYGGSVEKVEYQLDGEQPGRASLSDGYYKFGLKRDGSGEKWLTITEYDQINQIDPQTGEIKTLAGPVKTKRVLIRWVDRHDY